MAANSINYFYNLLNLPRENWKIFYDFTQNTVNTGEILSISGGNARYSAITDDIISGGFTGQSLDISHTDELLSDSWTMFFVFEKNDYSDGVLFSNYHESSNKKSGFILGVNSSNRLYIESYDENGPAIYESSIRMGQKNAIAVSKNENNIHLDYYNFNTKIVTASNFDISPQSMKLSNNGWHLGSAVNPPNYLNSKSLEGKLDYFLYITGVIFPNEIDSLFSGLCILEEPKYIETVTSESCNYSYIGLTGDISNVTFENLGISNYFVQTGILKNNTGEIEGLVTGNISNGTGYISGNITGYINVESGYKSISLSGVTDEYKEQFSSGLRVFKVNLNSGETQMDISFPYPFGESPAIYTTLEGSGKIIGKYIGDVTNDGFKVRFSESIPNDSYKLNILAGVPQSSKYVNIYKKSVQKNELIQTFDLNRVDDSSVCLFYEIQNESINNVISGNRVFENLNISGLEFRFSDYVENDNTYLNYIDISTGNLSNLAFCRNGSISVNPAPDYQSTFLIIVPFLFPDLQEDNPIVFADIKSITNNSGLSNTNVMISGNSGLYYLLLDPSALLNPSISLNIFAWNTGIESGIYEYDSTKIDSNKFGEISDDVENIYNVSGEYSIPDAIIKDKILYKSFSTGSNVILEQTGISIEKSGINIPVLYSTELTPDDTSFIHRIRYKGYGNNFISANHSLYYHNTGIQSSPFYVYKNCQQILGEKLQDYQYDNNYIYSFGMDGITYLTDADMTDVTETYTFPSSHNKTNLNIDAPVNRVNDRVILDKKYENDALNLYLNGVALFESGYNVDEDDNLTFDSDYFLSGKLAVVNYDIEYSDEFVYDVCSGDREIVYITGSLLSGDNINNLSSINKDIFLNGIKLISGYHYIGNGGGGIEIITDSIDGVTGKLFSLPQDEDYTQYFSGEFNSVMLDRFARGASRVWNNGVRQDLDQNYIEISENSLLTGVKIQKFNKPFIFSNNWLFWATGDIDVPGSLFELVNNMLTTALFGNSNIFEYDENGRIRIKDIPTLDKYFELGASGITPKD